MEACDALLDEIETFGLVNTARGYDLAVLLMRQVLVHLPDRKPVIRTARAFGFEMEDLNDSRLNGLKQRLYDIVTSQEDDLAQSSLQISQNGGEEGKQFDLRGSMYGH